MRAIDGALSQINELHTCSEQLEKPFACMSITGLSDEARLHMINMLTGDFRCRLIVTHNDMRLRQIARDYAFYDRNVCEYPARDLIFYQADVHGAETARLRMRARRRLIESRRATIVTTFSALMAPELPPDILKKNIIKLDRNHPVDMDDLIGKLVRCGYERTWQVEAPGQFAVRGDIIDIFDLTEDNPCRIELWGDEIESMRSFDMTTQRSIERLETVSLYPASELITDGSTLSRGLELIREDMEHNAGVLRDAFKTEEAHRLKETVEDLIEGAENSLPGANLESYIRYFYPDPGKLTDYLPAGQNVICLDEPGRILEHANAVEYEFRESMAHRAQTGYALPGQMDILSSVDSTIAGMGNTRRIFLSNMINNETEETFGLKGSIMIRSREIAPYNNSFEGLVKDLKRYVLEGYRILILSGSRTRAKRLAIDLTDSGVSAFYSEDPLRELEPREVMTYYGSTGRGFEYPDYKLGVIAESDIFTEKAKPRRKRGRFDGGERISGFSDLKPGDYVIHEDHGLGIYRGIEKLTTDKVERDYIKIEYADGASLYVLATGLDVIQKYMSGADQSSSREDKPRQMKLNSLGTSKWYQTKAKVRRAVEEIADDLVELYAKRRVTEGFRFSDDTVWQQEFEDAFPYRETEDQLNAIEDTKKDMESTRIMDRLICGDVGFGKTEIAIRAAFKAVQDGKQVAVLVPTTILAQQHYNTFTSRMQSFPVKVDMLSRFRTAAEQKKTIQGLEKGMVDIVIGTHRLLSDDVRYRDLGLLIVDEEQRFGVTHKEKIKKLRDNVDVLTLTATPIPRTLHMSLIGIRDMSVLEEAPGDRLPIQTFVSEYNEEMVREAIIREIARDGQVYYVYNRVQDIADVAARLGHLVPEARIAFAHGQMQERELERIMYDFIDGNIDVLVSTTIIETGLDIPNVNTMIIHDSDRMGLAQLYQLRGRVGRSNRTAYAFLMYRKGMLLQEVAEKRLTAIREFTDLGSGYKIAMRDLEIRGAGNLLGKSQSGHMEAVGYDLYCKMLSDAVARKKRQQDGEAEGKENEPGTPADASEDFSTSVDLAVSAYLSPDYIADELHKLELYKRIADIASEAELEEMREEMTDRFGEPPVETMNLLRISLIRARAHRLYITELKDRNRDQSQGREVIFKLRKDAGIMADRIPELLKAAKNRIVFRGAPGNPMFIYPYNTAKTREETGENLLNDITAIIGGMERILLSER